MHARPCRMGFGIDIEMQLRARRAIGAAGDEFRTIRHDDGDFVVIGVKFRFHVTFLSPRLMPLAL